MVRVFKATFQLTDLAYMHWLQRYSCLTGTANLEVRHRQYLYKDLSIFQLYFSILVMAFAASPSGATSVMLSTHFFDQNSAQNEFQLYL